MRHSVSCGVVFLVVLAALFAVVQPAGAVPVKWDAAIGGNGHHYEAIAAPGGIISWDDAKAAAEASSFMGCQGHLATITSAAENEFLRTTFPISGDPIDYFLGGFQPSGSSEPSGGWQWVNDEGPFTFTKWAGGEPNNAGGNEHVLATSIFGWASGGFWNDTGPEQEGYIVEWDTPCEEIPPQNPAELSKSERLAILVAANLTGVITLGLAKAALGTTVCLGLGPACLILVIPTVISAVIDGIELARIIRDPPDPDFTTIFLPQDYMSPTVGSGSGLPAKIIELANSTFAKLTDLYEITQAWRITLERYNAAIVAGDADAASMQLEALEDYVAATAAAASSVKACLTQLSDALEKLVGPVQANQSDIEAALADLSQNGFGSEEQEIFSSLAVSQEAINEILSALLALDPSEVPTDLFATLRQAAESYGELADISSSLIPTEVINLQDDTLASGIPGSRGKSMIKSLDKALEYIADGRARLVEGNTQGAKKRFAKASKQIERYIKILNSLVDEGKVSPGVANPLFTAANDIIAQINALIAGL